MSHGAPPRVVAGVVTWNAAGDIDACLEALAAQTWPGLEVVVADNASSDDTWARLEHSVVARRHRFDRNTGYAAAHNRLIRETSSAYYLALNPDVVLGPAFVATAVAALEAHASAGAAAGKLLRLEPTGIVDSTGIVMTPSMRHLDRGAGEPDRGQYDEPAEVFGVTGAAAFYRRTMLDDVAVDGEVFDEAFFAYREDADLAWRARLLGWRTCYVPAAVAWHRRRVTPERRASLPPEVNRWSVRNRFLLRLKNQTVGHALRFALPALWRDVQVAGYVLLRERTSLGAFGDVVRLLPRARRWRRAIMARRRATGREMAWWFTHPARPWQVHTPAEAESHTPAEAGSCNRAGTRRLRLAILGTRGIPASYGGFETFAEELGVRLAARGHDVTVYGRTHYVDPGMTSHRGVRLVVLPTVRHKYLDTLVHTARSVVHASPGRYDVLLVCNAANALVCAWPRLRGLPVALNVDGLEWKRQKWNALGRAWYLLSERAATWVASAIVTDAEVIRAYYRERYGAASTFIPYGCRVGRDAGRATLDRFGLEPDEYVLYVSRLEPENNALAVVEGYERTTLGRRLVVVGDAPYADAYKATLVARAGPRVVFTGAVYGEGYRELQAHAYLYVQATEVGGTHPALVEAMGFGNAVVANDVPEHREVLGEAAAWFEAADPDTLAAVLTELDADPARVERLRRLARSRAEARYSWDAVTEAYEALLTSLVRRQ